MTKSNTPAPFEFWRQTIDGFQQRVATPGQREPLDECADRRFMQVQAICNGVVPKSIPPMTGQAYLDGLEDELSTLFQILGVEFSTESYGQRQMACIDTRIATGLWCLILEIATMAAPGTRIEMSIGFFSGQLEVELGSDSSSLEQSCLLESQAFGMASQLMEISAARDLKCPLGGAAIQVNIPVTGTTSKRQAA